MASRRRAVLRHEWARVVRRTHVLHGRHAVDGPAVAPGGQLAAHAVQQQAHGLVVQLRDAEHVDRSRGLDGRTGVAQVREQVPLAERPRARQVARLQVARVVAVERAVLRGVGGRVYAPWRRGRGPRVVYKQSALSMRSPATIKIGPPIDTQWYTKVMWYLPTML